ncbi:hypothetical protein [Alkalibacillus haloalkaliphilus]|uniref:hypothetical protein n=1 Tax=Alkalibacillus haloalkaliphilus TaxID=94136 RepID=UPI000312F247|nr:hypothetical protein [Alkalibacillus haloalkaliphilus]
MNNLKIYNIIGNRGEEHEWMLVVVVVCSFLTFRRFNKLERYKEQLKGSFTPY